MLEKSRLEDLTNRKVVPKRRVAQKTYRKLVRKNSDPMGKAQLAELFWDGHGIHCCRVRMAKRMQS
jgi:hypothetical protein